MKKAIPLFIALFVLLSVFSACVKNDGNNKTTAAGITVTAGSTTAGVTANPGITAAPSETAKSGQTDETSKDGTTTFKNTESGSVVYRGGWPNNDIINMIPKPGFGTVISSKYNGNSATVSLGRVTKDEYNGYVAKLKAAGFNKNIKTNTSAGTLFIRAENSAGTVAAVTLYTAYKEISIEVRPAG